LNDLWPELKSINIGCGENNPPEYVGVDIRPEVKPDVLCDARILPFEDNRFEFLFSSHTLEHFSHLETANVLTEWFRILKPRGKFRFILPNLEVAYEYLKLDDWGSVLGITYGGQDYKYNFHMTGFTPKRIRQILEKQGMKVDSIVTGGYDIIVEGNKPC